MIIIDKNSPPTIEEIDFFIKRIDFILPIGFLDFFKEANGAEISTDNKFVVLWTLTDMIQLNVDYHVAEYAPGFFIFGSDGADIAYTIERSTGDVYEMPFIGMSKEEAIYISKTFIDFIKSIEDFDNRGNVLD